MQTQINRQTLYATLSVLILQNINPMPNLFQCYERSFQALPGPPACGFCVAIMNKDDQSELRETIYNFIVKYIDERGISPSYREISEACFIGKSSVSRYLDQLEAEGRLLRELGQPRTLRIYKPDSNPKPRKNRTNVHHL